MNALVSTSFNKPTLASGLSSALDRFIDDFFGQDNNSLLSNIEQQAYPKVNIREFSDKLSFECAVPGLTKEDIQVDYQPETRALLIKGISKNNTTEDQNGFLKRELKKSSFARWFTLGHDLHVDKISAHVENGMLYIDIPKKEKELPKYKKIEVK